jgi:hypothetical protein
MLNIFNKTSFMKDNVINEMPNGILKILILLDGVISRRLKW